MILELLGGWLLGNVLLFVCAVIRDRREQRRLLEVLGSPEFAAAAKFDPWSEGEKL